MLDVYCDSEFLLEQICKYMPGAMGLYLHEQAMIYYASIGRINYPFPDANEFFYFRYYGVSYPLLLLKSLMNRGFIRVADDSEFWKYIRIKPIQEFLKSRGLPPGNSTEKAIENLDVNNLRDDFLKSYGLGFYIPTEKGISAISDNSPINIYDGWNVAIPRNDNEKINRNDILIIHPKDENCVLDVDFDEQEALLGQYGFQASIVHKFENMMAADAKMEFQNPSNVTIKMQGKIVYEDKNVSVIRVLFETRKVLLFRKTNNGKYVCSCLNAVSYCLDFIEEVDRPYFCFSGYNYLNEYNYRNLNLNFSNIFTETINEKNLFNGIYSIFISINDPITEIIIEKFFSLRKGNSFEKLSLLCNIDEDVHNYKIEINKNDTEFLTFIKYLFIKDKISFIRICDAEILTIRNEFCFFERNNSKTNQAIHNEECLIYDYRRTPHKAVEKLMSYGITSLNSFDSLITQQCPEEIMHLSTNLVKYYLVRNNSIENNLAFYSEYDKKFNNYIIELKEKGYLPQKWISEFKLYMLIHKIFKEAVFQYRADWLERQSLDIYIPSIKTAIEYQGEQHYQPIDYFGGEENYKKNVERDTIKLTKCKEKGVLLLYWSYDLPISIDNLKAIMGEKYKHASYDDNKNTKEQIVF